MSSQYGRMVLGVVVVLSAFQAPTSKPAVPNSPVTLGSGSRIVYQSGTSTSTTSDIWIMNGDGTNDSRLTSSGQADYMARLNYGATKIVFSRNSNGQSPDLWTMDQTGQNQAQITNTPNDGEQFAVWSPDSSQIVFADKASGNTQIYLMNANGSNRHALTNSSQGIVNTAPSWTPDGRKIVFVSNRNGAQNQEVYCMNTDGSGQTRVTNGQVAAGGPVVSPDGTKLAFTDAPDGTWYVVYTMNFDPVSCIASNRQTIVNPGAQYWAWTPTWSPDSQQVAYSRTHFPVNSTNWDTSYVYSYNLTAGQNLQLTTGGKELRPWWATADTSPPQSQVSALPVYSFPSFTVSWSGTDNLAGIKSYDVQVKIDSGSWMDWLTGTTATSATYANATYGHTYAFRSRAIDYVNNQETYPDTADASTTTYSVVSGQVLDARERPVPHATLQFSPAPLITNSPNATGNWLAYMASPSTAVSVSASHAGYASPPASMATPNASSLNTYLTGSTEAVQNGGFETDLANWTGTATVSTDVVHSGSKAARLTGTASLAQTITVPAVNEPTLSLVVNLTGANGSPGSRLEVLINSTPVITLLNDSNGWTHRWADLSDWSGQTVSLSVSLTPGSGGPVSATIDEVSVAEWTTPVLDPTPPVYLPVGPSASLVITGSNFLTDPQWPQVNLISSTGAVTALAVDSASSTRLDVTIPAGVSFGMYDLQVVNYTGAEAVQPGVVRIGTFLFLPVMRR